MLNKVQLIGRTGKDPEVKHLDGGQIVASFSLATTEKFKDKSGETKEKTEWHNCQAWGKLAEIIEKFLTKGKLIFVEGKIQYREYENKDGQKVRTTDIVLSDMKMLEKRDGQTAPESKPVEQPPQSNLSEPGDDLPF